MRFLRGALNQRGESEFFNPQISQAMRRANCSADFRVCCIAGFQTCVLPEQPRAADLEIGDTAGWETGATAAAAFPDTKFVKIQFNL
ncbi:MAG TPA: hypothetical protein VI136_12485 [Verrucomicrobiae bacterium]